MHNAIVTFDDLFDEVCDLWPRYKTTKAELHTAVWARVSRYSGTDRFNALRKHRHEHPDAMRPQWVAVFAMLAANGQQRDADTFAGFLAGLRHTWKRIGTKGVDEMSDADVWYHWLEAQTFPITHDTRTRKPKPDLEACTHCYLLSERHPALFKPCNRMALACQAARVCQREAAIWIERIESAGHTVPSYLED